MKIIFLDFDGVICTSDSIRKAHISVDKKLYEQEQINAEKIKLLNQIVKATDAKIVISSAWRYLHSTQELLVFLRRKGFEGKIVGTTPKWSQYKNKLQTVDLEEFF